MYRPRIYPKNETERNEWISLIESAKSASPSALTPNLGSVQRWLVVSDVHRPFHNQTLWNKLLRLISDMGNTLYGIVLAGDYLDLYTLGSYNSNSVAKLSGLTLQDEYIDGLNGIDEIESAANKSVKKCFLFGNHEDRFFRHVSDGDNAKYGGALLNPIEALYLDEKKWEYKTDWQSDYFTLGKHLDVVHGLFCNIHAAKAHLDKTNHSVIFGHTHRIQCYHSGNRAAFNIGGLYDINSKGFKYMPRFQREQWANGFCIVNIDDNGFYYVEQINVWADKFLANGKMY